MSIPTMRGTAADGHKSGSGTRSRAAGLPKIEGDAVRAKEGLGSQLGNRPPLPNLEVDHAVEPTTLDHVHTLTELSEDTRTGRGTWRIVSDAVVIHELYRKVRREVVVVAASIHDTDLHCRIRSVELIVAGRIEGSVHAYQGEVDVPYPGRVPDAGVSSLRPGSWLVSASC